MTFLAGRGAWPAVLSRALSLRLSERSESPSTGEAGPGAGFQQEGQKRRENSRRIVGQKDLVRFGLAFVSTLRY